MVTEKYNKFVLLKYKPKWKVKELKGLQKD